MTRHTRRTAALATTAATLVVVLAGCGTAPTSPTSDDQPGRQKPAETATGTPPEAEALPSGSSGTPRPGLPDRKKVKNTPDAVSKAAVTVMWTMDTKIDVSQHDASARAARYGTATYARQIKDTPQRSAPGAEWNEWAEHDAYTRVKLAAANDAGAPEDTEREAYRTWTVTVTPHGAHGWTGEPAAHTAFVHLTRSGGGTWKVDAVQVQ